ncbi:MAG: four-carbon acid sugar kinase family protein, partial [Bacteroidota bacterium]
MTKTIIQESIDQGLSLPDLLAEVRQALSDNPRTIVVLDDDPTGTQTVHNVPVITNWSSETLEKEIAESPLFFILTNSRSLQQKEARELAFLLGQRLQEIAANLGKQLIVLSRSDSTLRGHYPIEVKALKEGMGLTHITELLIPAFFEGGRYTFEDVHYVKEGEAFVPAAETPFAKDKTFGYQASNLREWIAEKNDGEISLKEISS